MLKSFVAALALFLLVFIHPAFAAEIPHDQEAISPQIEMAAIEESNGGQGGNRPPLREIRVSLYENKPKIFTGENGRASGIFVGILDEVARRENWQVTYVPCEWSDCLAQLETGRIDLMPDMAFSPERDRQFDFHHEKVLESWSQVYVTSTKPARNWFDLDGRRVALLKDSIQQTVLGQMIKGHGLKISIIEADSYEEAFDLAAKGAVDAVVANHFFGNYYYQEYGLERTAIVFNPVFLYFATAQGANTDLLAAIDRNLRAMKSETGSVYYKELARWMERPAKVVAPRYLVWLIGGTVGALAVAFALILLLRVQVGKRTRDLVQANETLRESEEKFRCLFQNHPAVKLIIDPDNGNIVEANEAASIFYGWSIAELRRMRIQDINILSAEQIEAEMAKAKSEQRIHFEFRHRLADGAIKDVEVFSGRIDIKRKALLHSIIHDITEHRKVAEQYRQAQKMEAVGRLAGGVAHDYNNILSVIIGYTELALNRVGTEDPLHEDLTQIYAAAIRSRDITRQLLAFARKETIVPVVLDLNLTVESLLTVLRRLIREDIELVWRPGNSLWPVLMDPSQLDQILANLCVNARDAIDDVGKITIETGMVTFDEAYCSEHAGFVPGDFVLLSVSDDGCGMDHQIVEKIFEPFFTTKGAGQGTGLGLATVYGIVKQNNGFVNVYSEPGEGTTFKIYLPGHVGKIAEKRKQGDELPAKGNGETVLVVEDDIAILELVERILINLNYRVLTSTKSSAALCLAEAHANEISLLLTDVVMPEMNGRELAEKVTSLCPGIRCLFMSGYTADVIAHRGVLDKGFHFIQKPFSAKDLADKVRAALGGNGEMA